MNSNIKTSQAVLEIPRRGRWFLHRLDDKPHRNQNRSKPNWTQTVVPDDGSACFTLDRARIDFYQGQQRRRSGSYKTLLESTPPTPLPKWPHANWRVDSQHIWQIPEVMLVQQRESGGTSRMRYYLITSSQRHESATHSSSLTPSTTSDCSKPSTSIPLYPVQTTAPSSNSTVTNPTAIPTHNSTKIDLIYVSLPNSIITNPISAPTLKSSMTEPIFVPSSDLIITD